MHKEEQTITEVGVDNLVSEVSKMYDEGYRLVQIGCGKYDDIFEINYSFDKDCKFVNLRLKITEGVVVPSITGVYLCAFIYENEIHDLFGVSIKDIAIDFKGNLIRTSVKNPFNTPTVTKVKAAKPAKSENAAAAGAKPDVKSDAKPDTKPDAEKKKEEA
ncbi:NADH-quinone oxidoreductase subunit C [Methanomicrobium mobile]|uniref:NADH-quinone oxidoreductase subunit C n=1 Tax=Methanomicrobium mobile TaxID=2205 RepID=UPI000A07036F|nr:NADH-quinone oxidoreductase subunit C [Methanomicrobium mobile]